MKLPNWCNLPALLTFTHTIATTTTTDTDPLTPQTLIQRSHPASVRLTLNLSLPPSTSLSLPHHHPSPSTHSPTNPSSPRSLTPQQLPICTGPWPPIAAPNLFFFPLLDANIDLRIFPTLVDFCTAPRPADCHCAFDDRAGRWEVRCDHPGVPMAHAWGFLYAIHYCERWCACVYPEGLPDLQVVAAWVGLWGGCVVVGWGWGGEGSGEWF